MNRNDFYREEFATLHMVSDRYIRELFSIERFAVSGTVIVYAWLLVQPDNRVPNLAWYIPLIFGLLGAIRSYAVGRRLELISNYLKNIEDAVLSADEKNSEAGRFLGWERYWRARRKPVSVISSGAIFWIFLLGVQKCAPFFIS